MLLNDVLISYLFLYTVLYRGYCTLKPEGGGVVRPWPCVQMPHFIHLLVLKGFLCPALVHLIQVNGVNLCKLIGVH